MFDLKSGYHHIDVVDTKHEIMGFAYEDYQGILRYFKFVVLPFRLSSAGFIFTKVLRELIRHWRGLQIQALAFQDDGLQSGILTTGKWAFEDLSVFQIRG